MTVHALGPRAEWRWFIGCFKGSEAELRAEIDRKHGPIATRRDSCLLAVEYLVNLATLLAEAK